MYESNALVKMIFIGYMIVFSVAGIVGLISYIIKGIGMYTIGKRRGMKNSWLAFIPFGRAYFQGELSGPICFSRREIKNTGLWMVFFPIVVKVVQGIVVMGIYIVELVAFLGYAAKIGFYDFAYVMSEEQLFENMLSGPISLVGFMAMAGMLLVCIYSIYIPMIFKALVNYQIFVSYTDKNSALIHTIAGALIPLYCAIYFFVIRNRETGCQPEKVNEYQV